MGTKNKGFTLVEIVVAITILAVLLTIAFVSFTKYGVSSRDANRVVTLSQIEKGLNFYRSTTGKYPNVDEQSNIGQVNGEELSSVGVIGENITRLLSIQSIPLDPVSGNKYAYGVSYDKKLFQIAGTTEAPVVQNFVSSAYANNYRAKVLGNYDGLIKKSNKIYNLPSLIFTGEGDLLSPNTFFVINNGQNLPYKTSNTLPDNSVVKTDVLKVLTQRENISFTGINIPQTKEEFLANTGTYRQLGYPLSIVGQKLFGKKFVYEGTDNDPIVLGGALELPAQMSSGQDSTSSSSSSSSSSSFSSSSSGGGEYNFGNNPEDDSSNNFGGGNFVEGGGTGNYECLEVYEPVCGVDGITYSSSCHAGKAGVAVASQGPCGGGFGTPPEELY